MFLSKNYFFLKCRNASFLKNYPVFQQLCEGSSFIRLHS